MEDTCWRLPVDLFTGQTSDYPVIVFFFVYRWQKMLAILCHRWQKANTNEFILSNTEQK
jgi:hypothetical protein